MHLWSEYNEQKEDIVNSIFSAPIDACTNSHKETRFSLEVTKVDLAPFGIKLFI